MVLIKLENEKKYFKILIMRIYHDKYQIETLKLKKKIYKKITKLQFIKKVKIIIKNT